MHERIEAPLQPTTPHVVPCGDRIAAEFRPRKQPFLLGTC